MLSFYASTMAWPLQLAVLMKSIASPRTSSLALFGLGLLGCFGTVQIVPATQAPPPPAGSGWFCAEAAIPPRQQGEPYAHPKRCARTREECTGWADGQRREGAQVGPCEAATQAYCSATFTNATDANWFCSAELQQCSSHLGGMAGVPGTKQSECTAMN